MRERSKQKFHHGIIDTDAAILNLNRNYSSTRVFLVRCGQVEDAMYGEFDRTGMKVLQNTVIYQQLLAHNRSEPTLAESL